MKKLLISCLTFILLCCAVNSYALSAAVQAAVGVNYTSSGPSYLFSENFDGSTACGDGSHSNCQVTWTANGTPATDFNYSTSALDGTYSAQVTSETGNNYYAAFTAQDTVYFYFIIRSSTRVGGAMIFAIQDSSGNNLWALRNASYEYSIYCGSNVYENSTTWTEGTTYHVWGDYTKGTGANGICHAFIATTSTKPGSANITVTNSDLTGQASRVSLSNTTSSVYEIDKIRIDDVDIGSTPD